MKPGKSRHAENIVTIQSDSLPEIYWYNKKIKMTITKQGRFLSHGQADAQMLTLLIEK